MYTGNHEFIRVYEYAGVYEYRYEYEYAGRVMVVTLTFHPGPQQVDLRDTQREPSGVFCGHGTIIGFRKHVCAGGKGFYYEPNYVACRHFQVRLAYGSQESWESS